MSLPSQSSRNATRSSQVHYRRSSAGPVRKLLTILIILATIALVWFYLIRPRAAKIALNEEQTNAQNESNSSADTTTNLATNTPPSASTQQHQPTIINNSPSRPLPGSGDAPDAKKEVQTALRSNTTTPSRNTDILAAAAKQAKNTPITQPQTRPQTTTSRNGVSLQIDAARRLVAENNRVGARKLLSQTLLAANTTNREAQVLRDELTEINNVLLFSPVADPKDPMTENYKIKSGDSLSRIAARRELATHWKLIARINQIADPAKIRLGQNIKLVRGPFHAIVHKSAHRLDLFHGSPGNPESWLFIKSYDVGLGSNDGTPVGEFVVSANKLENPGWVNPRDAREQYEPNDPNNPIGEYWIGITGVGQYNSLTSLGLHGTIDQDSIGGNQSMGCVRLAKGDIDTVYELLAEHISRVLIVP